MNDGKIYIVITDNPGKLNGEIDAKKVETKQTEKESDLNFVKHQFYNFIESQAKQTLNYSISNYGFKTGNFQVQNDIEVGLRVLNSVKNIGISIAAGFKYGQAAGAVVAGVVAIASQAINFGESIHTANLQTNRQNYEINILRQKSGLDLYTNGSR